jgi:manganese/zinc/iron transport system substrate-binding protein
MAHYNIDNRKPFLGLIGSTRRSPSMKKIFRGFAVILSTVPFLWITACNAATKPIDADGIVQVTATTGMIADMVTNVGGPHVRVTRLMGPAVDPHVYKASQGDMEKLAQADLIFYNGLHLEGKMTEILTKMARSKPTIPLAEEIDKNRLLETGKGQQDPHIWLDVELWVEATQQVQARLIEIDPAHQLDYEKQAAAYLMKLNELDAYAQQQLSTIPIEQRVLVTAHDAFHYFGKAYDLEVVGLQGVSTAGEYGLKDIQSVVNLLTERKIKSVFVESSVSRRPLEAVLEGAKEKHHLVTIGGELFSDAMGQEGTTEGTYIGMVRHNVDTIVKALQ